MTRMTGPDCAVMCNLTNTHTDTLSVVPVRVSSLSRTQRCHGVEIKKE